MAEENASETPTGRTHTKIQDAFMSVPADAVTTTPEPASADLTWRGSKETEGEEIDYRCTAAHLDVRSDTGKLVGKMFSLTYVALGEDSGASSSRPVAFCPNG